MMQNRTKVRRRVLACARCRKRKLSCDGKVPACSRCVDAGAHCVGFDSSTQQEAPRSIADFLEAHITRLESLCRQASMQSQCHASATIPSPAGSLTSETRTAQYHPEKCAFADGLVNQVMADITPSFLGVTKARPLLQCVVRGTRLPSRKGPVGSNDLNENHPRSILNPQPTQVLFHTLLPDENVATTLLQNYLDRDVTQFLIYHRNDVVMAFNSIFHSTASSLTEDSIRNRYIVCIVMATSLTTSARNQVQKANDTAYHLVRHAMQWIPEVATNDIQGLQAILLLTQYIFLNPKMADLWFLTGLTSQAVIDLGLHQELPNHVTISAHERDIRRRLFWCAWEMEIGVCCIFLRPTSLPIRRVEVAFPLEINDTAITRANMDLSAPVSNFTQRFICRFRLIEAEIISVMWHREPLPCEYTTLEQWMQQNITAIGKWQQEVYASAKANTDPRFFARWNDMCLYSNIAHAYIMVSLYRSSRTLPQPSTQQMMIALINAIKVAEGYIKQSEWGAGKIKYVFHACHQVFNCALIFLQGLQRCKQEVAASYAWQQVEEWTHVFSTCLSSIAERWTAAKRCLDEYKRLLAPIKREYEDFLAQKARILPPSLRSEVSMTGLFENSGPVTALTEVDQAYNYWSVSNPTRGASKEMTESPLGLGVNIITPRDWSAEFNLYRER